MATVNFLPSAPLVAQVSTVQVTAADVSTTYKLTVGGLVVSALGTAADVNATAASVAAAWNADLRPYFTGVTAAAVSTDTITLTADVAGVPFIATSSVSGGSGTIAAVTLVTASSSIYHINLALNYSGGVLPSAGDTVNIDNIITPILWGFEDTAITGVTLGLINYGSNHQGKVGLPYNAFTTAADGSAFTTTVPEYRATYLKYPSTLFQCSSQSPRIKHDFGSVVFTGTVYNTATSGFETGLMPLRIKASNTGNVLTVSKGRVGIGGDAPGEIAKVSVLNVGYVTDQVNDSQVYVGSGGVVPTVRPTGGTTTMDCVPTSELTVDEGAKAYVRASGTITALNLTGTLDISTGAGTLTVTTFKVYKGATVNDQNGRLPTSTDFVLAGGANYQDVAINNGPNRTYRLQA